MSAGSLLSVNGDLFGVHKSTMSRIRKIMSRATASLDNNHTNFPAGNRILDVQGMLMQHSSVPGVVGLRDCTHIPNISLRGIMLSCF